MGERRFFKNVIHTNATQHIRVDFKMLSVSRCCLDSTSGGVLLCCEYIYIYRGNQGRKRQGEIDECGCFTALEGL